MIKEKTHSEWMEEAYKLAELALEQGEVPIGAIVVSNQQIIGKGYNQTERLKDATAHAEMIAITAAANFLNSKYLKETTLYVTMEPCLMCGGALYWSQVGKIVYGAIDKEKGCLSTKKNLFSSKIKIEGGILADKCSAIVHNFFKSKRKN